MSAVEVAAGTAVPAAIAMATVAAPIVGTAAEAGATEGTTEAVTAGEAAAVKDGLVTVGAALVRPAESAPTFGGRSAVAGPVI